jgi:uncharacterized protein (TIGR02246 family)
MAAGVGVATDEQAVRELVTDWVQRIENDDLDGVLADHTDDIVMFDVPLPVQSVGPEAYRRTWELFYAYQRKGVFRFDELHVTAGADVAYAFGLVTCGGSDPASHFRVRLTVGLRKVDGQWLIAHEHHSVPAT